ncbi:hypothetical protein [Dinghuibacter silviterrae]|uniref:DNA-binding SARP family transcriptional activator n=1 Tax=Dinghuibacter silviterrae TaxID=1539049 RepID=A0A4R8DR99_9BACT|nr:hypothetical protein [Dinghuibacter silviterrae]TDX00328.1 hypothetical protein EDB95_1349 [Dinghuibacter silviterrae]
MIVLCLSYPVLDACAQGLQFASEDSLLTQRTSLHVFGPEPPLFRDHLLIDFDLSLWDNSHLGYIFNLSDNDNSYSLSYLYMNGKGTLNFNIDRKCNKIVIPLSGAQLKKKHWLTCRIDLDLTGDRVTIRLDSTVYRADKLGFKGEMTANLVFGKNQYYTEVPNMAIRNLEVADDRRRYFFPLDEWSGTSIHDSKGDVRGFVENPVWLINASYFWKPVFTQAFREVAGLNYNPLEQDLFIFTKDSLIRYRPGTQRLSSQTYTNPLPVPLVLGKSIVNIPRNKCYVYELFDVAKGMPSMASLTLDSNHLTWETVGKATLPGQLHHHNVFYDAREDSIYLFGGYGTYSYHNDFLRYGDSGWQKVPFTGDTISPRFFAATGPSDRPEELLLFGGYGNESGSQVVGGKQYYDLYRINLRTHTVKRCWTLSAPGKDVFVPANNLVLSADKKYFYALCYPHEVAKTELRLYRFSIADGAYETVSAPIPVTSMRIESDINLFYSRETDEFLCAIQEFNDRRSSVIRLYTLAAPPVVTSTYLRSLHPPVRRWGILIWGLALGLATSLGWLLVRRFKKPPLALQPPAPAPVERDRNAVYMLGEFAVFDREGKDITHLFSPKIKQLFVLILLHSKEGKGISSKKISAKLWPEKDPAKTKNIRGVTFNHLRNIIGDIDGIELSFLSDTYTFRINEPFFCDYTLVDDVLRHQDGKGQDPFPLMARGPLLKDLPESLLDHYISDYEERLMAFLTPELRKLYEARDLKRALGVARLILSMDAFNEEALRYQLKVYKRLKGLDYSKKAYDQFTEDYKRSLGVAYHVSFEGLTN